MNRLINGTVTAVSANRSLNSPAHLIRFLLHIFLCPCTFNPLLFIFITLLSQFISYILLSLFLVSFQYPPHLSEASLINLTRCRNRAPPCHSTNKHTNHSIQETQR
jgi:hypothetical protein